jgi:class 3 adenylate cyclase/HAMP domain-containing protein
MEWFLISPFSINVLSAFILVSFMVYFLFRIKGKSKATRHLIVFLTGVALVFLSFFVIFSSLDVLYSTLSWWVIHAVVFATVAMVQFAYHFPENLHPRESKIALWVCMAASCMAYPYYIYLTLSINPIYSFEGHLFAFFDTPEIGVVIGLEILWMLLVFIRKTVRLSGYEYKGFFGGWVERPVNPFSMQGFKKAVGRLCIAFIKMVKARNRQAKALRNLFLVFISPIVLISAIVMAYKGFLSWEIVAHILGSGCMIMAFVFTLIYINNSSEPSTFLVKLIGISLGTVLIVAGIGANIAISIKDNAYDRKRLQEIAQCRKAILAKDFSEVPKEVAYIISWTVPKGKLDSQYETVFSRKPGLVVAPAVNIGDIQVRKDAETRTGRVIAKGVRQYAKVHTLNAKDFYIHYDFSIGEQTYDAGFSYVHYRRFIHETALTLLYVILGAVLFVIVVFPLFFHESLVRPLNSLLDGVRKVNQGDLEVAVPVQVEDEIGFLSGSFNRMVQSVLEAETRLKDSLSHQVKLTEAYSCFVPRELLKFLEKESIIDIRLGDHVQREMTILFSDIRFFTLMSERMSPQENFDFINSYLMRVGPLVRKHHGFIDKYIGDAVMALFPHRAEDALWTAIEMQGQVRDFNTYRKEKGFEPIDIGVGIHTGLLMLGTIGEEKRMDGTVISDAVNLASRIEGLTKLYGAAIILSDQTLDRIQEKARFEFRYLDRVKVKGKENRVEIFEVMDADSSPDATRKLNTKMDFETGIRLYQQGEYGGAAEHFKSVLKADPGDRAARLYLERCERSQAEGVPV